MNKRVSSGLALSIILLIAGMIGGALWLGNEREKQAAEQTISFEKPGPEKNQKEAVEARNDLVACTQEAKLCADGSYVSRTGPNCEFAECPSGDGNNIVGNDRDEHGCIGSAGYSWCEEKQKCLRSWEENCGALE